MKTSYFANPLLDRSEHFLIQVSNSAPKGFVPDYKLEPTVPDWKTIVAPYKDHLLPPDEYAHRYLRQLDGRKEQIVRELYTLLRQASGREPILLCYEKPKDFCHRHILAAWICQNGLEDEIEEMQNSLTPSLFEQKL